MSDFFADLYAPEIPSAISSDLYKSDGIYVGEAIIKRVLKNGKYRITTNDNRNFDARGVFNMGEVVFPVGIPVFCLVQNADAFIVGRVRPTKDTGSDDGEVDTDRSDTVGTEGDATLKPHSPDEKNISGQVTVTRGSVVKVVSTGATSITLHPHGERIIQKCQTLLAFSDAYRIESGRITSKAGVTLGALTEETYKDKVGPSRTEVRISNGQVADSVVHQLSVDSLVTAAGTTTGIPNFKWTIDSDGNWQIENASTIKVGDSASEPIVLGNQFVAFARAIVTEMNALRTAVTVLGTALAAAGTTLASGAASAGAWPGPVGGQPVVAAFGTAAAAAGTAASVSATTSSVNVTATQLQYLTPLGISKEAVLSDFFSTQKIAPIPIPFTESE